MDLDTFFTTLYVWIDDWYLQEGEKMLRRHAGPALLMSDSEVLTIALAGQWRVGVPWRSERGIVRYMQQHGRGWFPRMLQRSAFNERVRQLWSAFVCLQQRIAGWLETADLVYEVVDCVPLRACSLAHAASHRHHWLMESHLGRGGNHGNWFFGQQLLASVTAKGAVTGWLWGAAQDDDRWLMQLFISARAGQPELVAPAEAKPSGRKSHLPTGWIRPLLAVGVAQPRPYLADEGFNGQRWQRHWRLRYGADLIAAPPSNTPERWTNEQKRWLSSHRQIVDTVFSRLTEVFSLNRLNAHSDWGLSTRLAAMMAAYNCGLFLNQSLGRPLGALATLLC
jgi:hypothetical protein